MNAIKYDGYDPKNLGPAVLGLYDLLHRGHITRDKFNQLINRAEADDELWLSSSQYDRENRYI